MGSIQTNVDGAERHDFDLRRTIRQCRQARSYLHPVERLGFSEQYLFVAFPDNERALPIEVLGRPFGDASPAIGTMPGYAEGEVSLDSIWRQLFADEDLPEQEAQVIPNLTLCSCAGRACHVPCRKIGET